MEDAFVNEVLPLVSVVWIMEALSPLFGKTPVHYSNQS